jgi:hypothetical protein
MRHPKEDEIRRLVENWAAWTGDQAGAVYSVSPIAWDEATYARREAAHARPYVVKSIGVDAQLTGEALAAMVPREARALKCFCLSSLTAAMVAREHMHCSVRTYDVLVNRGLSAFWELYSAREREAWRHRAEMATAGRK